MRATRCLCAPQRDSDLLLWCAPQRAIARRSAILRFYCSHARHSVPLHARKIPNAAQLVRTLRLTRKATPNKRTLRLVSVPYA